MSGGEIALIGMLALAGIVALAAMIVPPVMLWRIENSGRHRQANSSVRGNTGVGAQGSAGDPAGKAGAREAAIPNAGVRIGHVTAWRVWLVSAGWLRSVTQEFDWPPGGIVEAHKLGIPLGEGIHAFKHRAQAISYIAGSINGGFAAIGQIAMWGNIVEFEHGYHGEYAKVISICGCWQRSGTENWKANIEELKDLRATYEVGGYVRPE